MERSIPVYRQVYNRISAFLAAVDPRRVIIIDENPRLWNLRRQHITVFELVGAIIAVLPSPRPVHILLLVHLAPPPRLMQGGWPYPSP